MGRGGPWMASLLAVLAGQRATGRVAGTVRYDGNALEPGRRGEVALVSREGQFACLSCLTVREVLVAAAKLRRPGPGEKAADKLIELLGLRRCADVRVGSATVRGVSGGEKKRLAIALGLLAEPRAVPPPSGTLPTP